MGRHRHGTAKTVVHRWRVASRSPWITGTLAPIVGSRHSYDHARAGLSTSATRPSFAIAGRSHFTYHIAVGRTLASACADQRCTGQAVRSLCPKGPRQGGGAPRERKGDVPITPVAGAALSLCHGGSSESALLLQRGAVVGSFHYRIREEQSPAAVAAAVALRSLWRERVTRAIAIVSSSPARPVVRVSSPVEPAVCAQGGA